MVDDCDHRGPFYLTLNRFTSHSKNPGCFCACTRAGTGLAFFFGVVVGVVVAGGDGVNITVGGGILVGNRVGVLDGIIVGGVALNMAFLYFINR